MSTPPLSPGHDEPYDQTVDAPESEHSPTTDAAPATAPPDGTAAAPAPTAPTTPPEKRPDPLRASRTSAAWAGLVAVAVIAVLLVVFVLQNTGKVSISFLWMSGRAPLALALVIAAVAGMVIVGLVGSARILQLRRRVRREKKALARQARRG